ncbi:hypothetical protein Tcan_09995 [Toxocara canis]|uniref:Uncharacterized protein n=1 Tax=Toxocara canis TaxID=6265 RepID=A0A0B2UUN6_TOXCA|nr:hypothetical protein Tcan_09995 [Toxocara canis]
MDNVKNKYEKVVAFILLSTAIASFIAYRYFFSRGVQNEKRRKKCDEELQKGSRSLNEVVATVSTQMQTSESSASISQPESRLSAVELPQIVRRRQKAVDDKKSGDEIDVEFSPARSPAKGTERRPGDNDLRIPMDGSLGVCRKVEAQVDKASSPPLSEESTVNTYYCDCGQTLSASSVTGGELSENTKLEIMQTQITPICFDHYTPVNLLEEQGTGDLSDNSLTAVEGASNHRIIQPFLPILNAITYASKHAELLSHLLENYQFYERNYDN